MKKLSIILFIFLNCNIFSQTSINPDISAIGLFNASTNIIQNDNEFGKLIFESPDMELFFEGYLNPYARATFNIAYESNTFFVEELYADILRGLPLDMQIKVGKYLLGFGKINTIHPHAWSFLYRPLFQQIYFSEDGFNDIGLNVSFILPTEDFFTTLDLGVFNGDAIAEAEGNDSRGKNLIFSGRLSSFFSLSDFSNLEFGLSGSYGVHSKNQFDNLINNTVIFETKPLYYLYGGIDFKYKYRPDSYTSLTIQGEGIWNHRDVQRSNMETDLLSTYFMEQINTFGAFIYIDYRFNKIFSVGTKYDFTYGIIGDGPAEFTLANDDKNTTQGLEGWFGYYPAEETLALRFGVQHLVFDTQYRDKIESETRLLLQLIFSLGPHKAHPF